MAIEPMDREQVRANLRQMDDDQLRKRGRNLIRMCSPSNNEGKQPSEALLIQLEEARAELNRRGKKKSAA
jgi:hypothetical protein